MTVPRPHGSPSPTRRREEAAPRSCPEVWLEGRSREKPGEGRAGQAPLPSSWKVPASSPVLKYLFQHKLFSIEERLPRLWLPLWHLFSKSVQICSKTCQGWRDGLTPVCHPSGPSGAPKSLKYRASRQLCVMGWDIVGMPRGTPWNPPRITHRDQSAQAGDSEEGCSNDQDLCCIEGRSSHQKVPLSHSQPSVAPCCPCGSSLPSCPPSQHFLPESLHPQRSPPASPGGWSPLLHRPVVLSSTCLLPALPPKPVSPRYRAQHTFSVKGHRVNASSLASHSLSRSFGSTVTAPQQPWTIRKRTSCIPIKLFIHSKRQLLNPDPAMQAPLRPWGAAEVPGGKGLDKRRTDS